MLRQAKALERFRLGARDGVIGRVKDLYFDDQSWTVRYLVADTGTWLADRQVLISPWAVKGISSAPDRIIAVDLTKAQIEQSPPIDADKPVSRQVEAEYHQYYAWPAYWEAPWAWGLMYSPDLPTHDAESAKPSPQPPAKSADVHLRSTREVYGYAIQARDGHFGQVEDFLVDEDTWQIRYLVVDLHKWWPGKKVLAAPQWISRVSWPWSRVYIELDQEVIKAAPAYDPAVPITREYEEKLFRHYHREPYWGHPLASADAP